VVAALLDLASANGDRRLLAVTHGGPIRAAAAAADGISYAEARRRSPVVGNATVLELAVESGKLRRLD
jgi:broad specificity phosphatase PhoE